MKINAGRIRSIATIASLFGIVTGAGIATWGYFREARQLKVTRMRVELPVFPSNLKATTIAFFSDLHLDSRTTSHRLLTDVRTELERIQPDLILIGGDYYNKGRMVATSDDFARISQIAPSFGVLGNHDYNYGNSTAEPTRALLEDQGITILRNQSVNLTINDQTLSVIGVDDPFTWRDRTPEALAESDHAAAIRLLLGHAPNVIDTIRPGDVHIALAGHTHAGQIRLSPTRNITPLDANWWVDTTRFRPTAKQQRGLHWDNGTLLFVSNGVGTTGLPIRFMAPPELVILELICGVGRADKACDDPERYVTRENGIVATD